VTAPRVVPDVGSGGNGAIRECAQHRLPQQARYKVGTDGRAAGPISVTSGLLPACCSLLSMRHDAHRSTCRHAR
jgi:hypothetical protein